MNRILTLLAGVIASMAMAANVSAQNGYEVKGVVIDQIGPVVGATVMEAGTAMVSPLTWTVIYLKYLRKCFIEVSCIGYTTQTFTASQMPATVSPRRIPNSLERVSSSLRYGEEKAHDRFRTSIVPRVSTAERHFSERTVPVKCFRS